MAEPQELSSFLRVLTGTLPRRWPRSAPLWGKTVAQAQKAYEKAKRR